MSGGGSAAWNQAKNLRTSRGAASPIGSKKVPPLEPSILNELPEREDLRKIICWICRANLPPNSKTLEDLDELFRSIPEYFAKSRGVECEG